MALAAFMFSMIASFGALRQGIYRNSSQLRQDLIDLCDVQRLGQVSAEAALHKAVYLILQGIGRQSDYRYVGIYALGRVVALFIVSESGTEESRKIS